MKNNNKIGFTYMLKTIFPMCFRANPALFVVFQVVNILTGLTNGAILLATQWFFDEAVTVSESGEMSVILAALAVFVGLKLCTNILYTAEVYSSRVTGYMMSAIHKKSADIDPIMYEDPAYLDDINKAAYGVGSAIYFSQVVSFIFTFHLPYFVFLSAYLTKLHPALVLCLLFVFIPTLASHLFRSAIYAKMEDSSAPIRRKVSAYSAACSGKDFYKETRALGAFGYFRSLLCDSVRSLNEVVWKTQKKSAVVDFGFNTLHLMGYVGVFALAFMLMLRGAISVGAFTAVFTAIDTMFASVEYLIGSHIGSIAEGYGEIRNFLGFLRIEPRSRENNSIDKKSGIQVENATFRYPNSDVDTLKNINLTINPGETVAIVGENGAGKSTLVKLLMGMYTPDSGSVKYGKADLKFADYGALFDKMSGVFQKYSRYALTLRDNVKISDLTADDAEKIAKVLRDVHLDKDDKSVFPDELDTMLSREFDGVDLSGGQWQRIAIARGIYRECDMIVLDEPTAAIDPIEESNIYREFAEMAKGKTATIVTHRIGSAKIADRIVVMKDGKVAEEGTHRQLLEKNGVYAEMYAAQAKWY